MLTRSYTHLMLPIWKKIWRDKDSFVTIMFSEACRRSLLVTLVHHRGLLRWHSCPYIGSIASSTSSYVARPSWKSLFSWSPSRRSISSFRSSSIASSNHSTYATLSLSLRSSLSCSTWRRTRNNSAC